MDASSPMAATLNHPQPRRYIQPDQILGTLAAAEGVRQAPFGTGPVNARP
jgi:hypothetical protein